jgi:adenylate kinase
MRNIVLVTGVRGSGRTRVLDAVMLGSASAVRWDSNIVQNLERSAKGALVVIDDDARPALSQIEDVAEQFPDAVFVVAARPGEQL